MNTLIFTTLQENRGKRRIWFQGQSLANAGIEIGQRYDRIEGTGKLVLVMNPEGKRKVSRKKSGGLSVPLIDIENEKLAEIFPFDVGTQLRIVCKNGRIIIRVHPDVAAKHEREQRILKRFKHRSPLIFAQFIENGSLMTTSLNEGLRKAGHSSYVQLGAEVSDQAFNTHFLNQELLWSESSKLCRTLDSLLDVLNTKPEPVDFLYAGDPSLQVNDDSQVAPFYFKLRAVEALNPAVVMFEVDRKEAAAPLLTVAIQILNQLGYVMQYKDIVFNDSDRKIILGVSKGIAQHDWTLLLELPTGFFASNSKSLDQLDQKAASMEVKSDSYIVHRNIERCNLLMSALQNKEPLAGLSLFHGGGILASAFHRGFSTAGIASKVAVGVELESTYLSSSLINNRTVWSDESFVIQGSIHQTRPTMLAAPCHYAEMGIPCSGASLSGRSKNKLAHAEEHSSVGTMFYWALRNWESANPAFGVIENVTEYLKTASMAVIRDTLKVLGYRFQKRNLIGGEFGALENRTRMCFLALSDRLPDIFSLDDVTPIREKERCLGEILEDIPLDDPMYKTFDYLAKKEAADIASGKGFRRQLLSADATKVGTIGAGYSRCRSTEPFYQHPSVPTLSRLLTLTEHARVKSIPVELVDGLTATTGHKILGQSIVYCAFEAVALKLGQSLIALAESQPSNAALQAA